MVEMEFLKYHPNTPTCIHAFMHAQRQKAAGEGADV